jgi:peptidoglycan/LPS O-acetylase OafA/YrhL
MFGCLIALLQGHASFERLYAIATKIWWIPPAVIVVSDLLTARFQNYWDFTIGLSVCGIAIAIFLLWCVRNPSSAMGRVLNSAAVVHIGVLSYSIYIWQTLFLNYYNLPVFGPHLKLLYTFPFSWLAILIVAELSHRLVELPSLRLRNYLLAHFRIYVTKRQTRQTSMSSTNV